MEAYDRDILSILQTHTLYNVFNGNQECRTNMQLDRISSCAGSFEYLDKHYPLPTNDEQYYVYIANVEYFYDAINHSQKWISINDLCNDHNILYTTYTSTGEQIHYGDISICYVPIVHVYAIAIKKRAVRMFLSHKDAQTLYMSQYRDSNREGDVSLSSYCVPVYDKSYVYRQKIMKELRETQGHCIVNGYKRNITSSGQIPEGALVDILTDRDIKYTFSVDLDTDAYVYRGHDELYRYLIHMPKALNPDNRVLTHNRIEFYLRDKDTDKSVLLHRFQTHDRIITQLTHQDYGIPQYIINAYRDSLQQHHLCLDVYVRVHKTTQHLIPEKSRIELLYTQSDKDIIDCIMGYRECPEVWHADKLESSAYTHSLMDYTSHIDAQSLTQLIDVYGYYNTVGILCKRIKEIVITDHTTSNKFTLDKPRVFYGQNVFPFVYLNGKKIAHSLVSFTNDINRVVIDIDPQLQLFTGDTLVVEFFLCMRDSDKVNPQSYVCTPTEHNHTLDCPYANFTVYIEEDIYPRTAHGVFEDTSLVYTKVDDPIGVYISDTDKYGNTSFVFNESVWDKRIIVQPKGAVHVLEANIDPLIERAQPLVFELVTDVNRSTECIPLHEFNRAFCYLNGHCLTLNVDYTVQSIERDGHRAHYEMVIQTAMYLEDSNNTVEIYCVDTDREDSVYGFLVDGVAYANESALCIPDVSIASVNGLIDTEMTQLANCLYFKDGVYPNGSLVNLVTRLPYKLKQTLNTYHPNDDIEILESIDKYFNRHPHNDDRFEVLAFNHAIYSLKIAKIAYDLIHGDFQLAYDADEHHLLDQISDYDYLDQYDLIHQITDRSHIDIMGSYCNTDGISIEMRKALERIIELTIGDDKVVLPYVLV